MTVEIQITRDTILRDTLSPVSARGTTDVFVAGELRGPDFITLCDKPGGVVPGALLFALDSVFMDNFNGAMIHFGENEKHYSDYGNNIIAGNDVSFEHKDIDYTFRRAYKDYCDVLVWDNDVEKSNVPSYQEFIEVNLQEALRFNRAASQVTQDHPNENSFPRFKNELERNANARRNPLIFTMTANAMERYNQQQMAKDPETPKLTTYFVKMDYKDPTYTGRVGPSKRRTGRTNTAKKAGREAREKSLMRSSVYKKIASQKGATHQDAMDAAEADPKTVAKAEKEAEKASSLIARVHNTWKVLAEGNIVDQGTEAVLESIATKHAVMSGMPAQFMQTFPGSWEKDIGKPKILTFSVWEKMHTFEDLCKTDETLGFSLQVTGGINGTFSDSSYMAYKNEEGQLISASHLVIDLGQQLGLMLRHFDRDAMGKAVQNKGIRFEADPNNPDKQVIKMFGIDFGHAFVEPLKNVRDDFTFEQPTNSDAKNLVNYDAFYDTLYSDRMVGIQVLAKQYAINVPDEVKASYPEVWGDQGAHIKVGSHLQPFIEERTYYEDKLTDAKQRRNSASYFSSAHSSAKQEIAAYEQILKGIDHAQSMLHANDQQLLEVFQQRIHLTREEVDLLDNIEKLISDPSTTSHDGEVYLNYLRVEREARIPVQLIQQDGKPELDSNGNYQLKIDSSSKSELTNIIDQITKFADRNSIDNLNIDPSNGIIVIPKDQINKFNNDNIRAFLKLEAKPNVTPEITAPKGPVVDITIPGQVLLAEAVGSIVDIEFPLDVGIEDKVPISDDLGGMMQTFDEIDTEFDNTLSKEEIHVERRSSSIEVSNHRNSKVDQNRSKVEVESPPSNAGWGTKASVDLDKVKSDRTTENDVDAAPAAQTGPGASNS